MVPLLLLMLLQPEKRETDRISVSGQSSMITLKIVNSPDKAKQYFYLCLWSRLYENKYISTNDNLTYVIMWRRLPQKKSQQISFMTRLKEESNPKLNLFIVRPKALFQVK